MTAPSSSFHRTDHLWDSLGLSRPVGWSLIRETRFEDHDGAAASDRVVDRRGFGEAGFDNPLANEAGGPGRAGADAVGLPGRPLVLCGGSRFGRASSDGPALRRAGVGLWPDGGARRSSATGKEPTITAEAKAWLVLWPAARRRTWLSARGVDDAASGSPRARTWTRRGTRLPRQAGQARWQDPQ